MSQNHWRDSLHCQFWSSTWLSFLPSYFEHWNTLVVVMPQTILPRRNRCALSATGTWKQEEVKDVRGVTCFMEENTISLHELNIFCSVLSLYISLSLSDCAVLSGEYVITVISPSYNLTWSINTFLDSIDESKSLARQPSLPVLIFHLAVLLLYSHLHVHAASQRYNNKDRRTQKDAGMKDPGRKTQETSLQIYLPLTLLHWFERVVQGLKRVTQYLFGFHLWVKMIMETAFIASSDLPLDCPSIFLLWALKHPCSSNATNNLTSKKQVCSLCYRHVETRRRKEHKRWDLFYGGEHDKPTWSGEIRWT